MARKYWAKIVRDFLTESNRPQTARQIREKTGCPCPYEVCRKLKAEGVIIDMSRLRSRHEWAVNSIDNKLEKARHEAITGLMRDFERKLYGE
jgi:hypothetical protein